MNESVDAPAITAPTAPTPGSRRRLRACHECDWVVSLPALRPGERADCPRCGNTLVVRHFRPAQRSMAFAVSALVALALAVSFPFVSLEVGGFGSAIELPQTATTLIGFQQPLVAIAVALTIIVLPAVYLLSVIWLQFSLLQNRPLPGNRSIARFLPHLTPWMMADVFIIGALVSLIKLSGSAEIALGVGFWAFCSFALLLLCTTQSIDADWMWFSLAGEPLAPEGLHRGQSAASQGVAGCGTCGLINSLSREGHGVCRRCGDALHARLPHSLQRTWALIVAAVILYIPANLYPMMTSVNLGQSTTSTIISGVAELWSEGSWPVAMIIFIASIVVPVGKLLVLSWLCLMIDHSDQLQGAARVRLYRITEFIGRWSMVDVFVLAILVALIRTDTLMTVNPGPAALAFTSVVVLTMLAAITFDPRLIWDKPATRVSSTNPGHQVIPT